MINFGLPHIYSAPQAAEVELTPTEGNVTVAPFAIPARTPSPSAEAQADPSEELCPDMVYAKRYAIAFAKKTAEPTPAQNDTAENATPAASIMMISGDSDSPFDHKSDDLDHQLTLGSEFVFIVDGREGAPTTAVIKKLGDGLYRAEVAADTNGNYEDGVILFLGDQVVDGYYHSIIVSTKAVLYRQYVANWIYHNGLHGADLSRVDFSWLDMSAVRLTGCNLSHARFNNTALRGAEITGCNLSHAYLSCARLTGADLRLSDLRHANLSRASMVETSLAGCDLSFADLRSADLARADFTSANTHSANFAGASLRNIYGASLKSLGLSA